MCIPRSPPTHLELEGAGKGSLGGQHPSVSVELSAGNVVDVADAKNSPGMTELGTMRIKYVSLWEEDFSREHDD